MKKFFIFFLALLVLSLGSWAFAEQQWINFTLIDRPHIDPATKNDIRGMNYPNLAEIVILEKYEKGTNYLVCVNGPSTAITAIQGQTEFKPELIFDGTAQDMKVNVFGILIPVVSGVTP